MANIILGRTQTADATPFEPNRVTTDFPSGTGIVSQDVQSAIEEIKLYASKVSRFCVASGFDGTASAVRYLEFITNVASNNTGFVVPRSAKIKEITLACQSNATTTAQVVSWNGTSETLLQSISLSASRKNSLINLDIPIAANTEIRTKITSGSCAKPMLYIFFVFE